MVAVDLLGTVLLGTLLGTGTILHYWGQALLGTGTILMRFLCCNIKPVSACPTHAVYG